MGSEPAPIPLGTVIGGKYRVDKVLGGGGMGVILAGRHLQLDQRVAIKVLRKAAIDDPEVTRRFAREAKAAAKIRSEHVARVLDVGTLDDGLPYIVMELLHGSDLAKLVRTSGPLQVSEAIDYVLQACEALAEAHSFGIIHRDLKPANLFLSKRADGSSIVKVLDFGISKMLPKAEADGDSLTKTAVMMGSPHYMSPEQLKSARDVDERADIWSLGALLFRLLTGKTPFVAETTAELCAEILIAEPASLVAENPKVPPELEAVVRKCLAKERENRWRTIGELAEALAPFGPTRSRESVDRIVATISQPRLSSVPPPSEADVVTETAPSDKTNSVDVSITENDPRDQTMTTGAASVSAAPIHRTADPTPTAKTARRGWTLYAVGGAFAVAAIGSIAFVVPRGDATQSNVPASTGLVSTPALLATNEASAAASAAASPSIPSSTAPSAIPVVASAPTNVAPHSTANIAARPTSAAAAAPTTKPSAKPSSAATAAAPPPPATTAAAAPTPGPTSTGLAGFGERK